MPPGLVERPAVRLTKVSPTCKAVRWNARFAPHTMGTYGGGMRRQERAMGLIAAFLDKFSESLMAAVAL